MPSTVRPLCVALLSLTLSLFATSAAAEEAPPKRHVPVSAEVFPGIGLNHPPGPRVVNNLSFGLIAAHAEEVDGLGLSSVVSLVDQRVRGAQVSGVFNLTGAAQGAQLAGAINLATQSLRGAQVSGAFNLTGAAQGAQLAGAINLATQSFRGAQVAGAFNLAGGDSRGLQSAGAVNVASQFRGLQMSGAANLADQLTGLQLSVLNIGGEVSGAQVGVVNIARKVRGLQLGVVNVSSEMYGAPVGLVSVAGNGQLHLQAWADDVAPTHLTLKYGSKYLYSMATVGFELQREGPQRRWLTGLGLGGHLPLGRFYVDIDASALNAHRNFLAEQDTSVLGQLRVVGGYTVARHLSVFAGVTGNTLVDWGGSSEWGQVGLGPSYEVGSQRTRVALWPGLAAGVQL